MSFVLWRAYIGPPFSQITNSRHYDWSVNDADATPSLTAISTVLSSQLLNGATTANVNSAGSFPSTGGFWVGPTASRWSWINYSGKTGTTFTGCQWTGDNEEDTTHANGSQVKMWYDIPENNGELTMTWEMDSNLATSQWTADIGGGVKIPQIAIRNNHLIIVQKAASPGGTFSNWLIGWLHSPNFGESAPYRRQWSAKIVSSATMIGLQEIAGVRISDLNIARDGSPSGQSTLAAFHKERHSGDYVAAEPDLSPTSTVDGLPSTPWIAEHVVGTTLSTTRPTTDTTQPGELIITQARLAKTPGEPDGYRWIEISVTADGYRVDHQLIAGNGNFQGLGVRGDYVAGDKIIICEDDVLFQQQNPLSQAALIFSVEDEPSNFFNTLDLDGDSLGLWFDVDVNEGWTSLLMWGTGAAYPDAGSGKPDPPTWTGAKVTAPLPGQTMRYKWTDSATPANNWVTDYNDHAGYKYSNGNDFNEIWYHLQLPSMGLKLAHDVASGYTGVITLKDDSGETTGGLPSSGTVQIGSSIVTYNSKTDTTITLTSAPTANHVEGDPVYVYFSSVSSDGVPINRIRWTAGTIYPKNFEILYSRLPNARTPGTSAYLNDYVQLADVTNHASNTYELTFSTVRARHIVMLIDKMSVDPARVRMNEFEVYLDRTYYDTDTWLEDGAATTGLFETLLTLANIPSGAMVLTDDGNHDLTDVSTEPQNAWTVAADLADFTGYRLMVERDSKLTIAPETFWTSSSYSAVVTWTRSNASEVRMLQDVSGIGTVKQIKLSWRSPDEATDGVEVYPPTPEWRGSVIELGPTIFADATAAQIAARKQYFLRKYPYTMYVRPVTPSASYKPGQIHRVQWQFDNTRAQLDRYFVVTSISNEFGGGSWKQSLNMLQVSREMPN